MSGTRRSILISTQLRQIAERAITHPDRVFTSLIHRMDFDFLREAFYELRRDGAPGLSGITVKDYEKDLEANLKDLHERLRTRTDVAPPIKRVWIDKDNGKKRPIGLVEIEDKSVQKAVSMLMGAVFEQDFLPISYGFREGCNAHDALAYLREQGMTRGIRWIYDADITGFFDSLDWGWLRTFIQTRINDGGVLRLIGKWLNAGIMEGEQISYSDKGTPQGGVISPLLANIYLHYVLDEWFETEVKPRMRGHCFLVRFADDCAPRRRTGGRKPSVQPCCTRDEGGPLEAAVQAEASNHPLLLPSREVVVRELGKGRARPGQVRTVESNASEPLMRCRKRRDDVKTGGESLPRDQSGGNLFTARAAPGMKAARLRSRLLCGTWEPLRHERERGRDRSRQCEAARETRVGPSEPACRRRLQTASSCCGPKGCGGER